MKHLEDSWRDEFLASSFDFDNLIYIYMYK